MNAYERTAFSEMQAWRKSVQRPPGFTGRLTRRAQEKLAGLIPEKVHQIITTAFRGLTSAVLAGSEFVSPAPVRDLPLEAREEKVRRTIERYKNAAAAEGALTGAGSILLGLADFPLWLTLKMKMLFDLAAAYGFDTSERRERVFLLHVFQLAFSSRGHRRKIYKQVADWDAVGGSDESLDWRAFQQEYRDYIDLAKMLQLVPGIGAVVGAVVNHRLTNRLGATAMQAYRMRWFAEGERV